MERWTLSLTIGVLAFASGCDSEEDSPPSTELEGEIVTEGGLSAVAVADLDADDTLALDVVALSSTRAQVDVFVRQDETWTLFGSAFTGEKPPVQLARGRVHGLAAIAVLLDDGQVNLLTSIPSKPHRLRFPVRILPGSGGGGDEPSVRRIALGDVDGDGSDELLVARRTGVMVVGGLGAAIDADPEHPPSLTTEDVDGSFEASALTAVAFAESDMPGLLATAADAPQARLYRRTDQGFQPTDIELDDAARLVVPSDCPDWAALVVGEAGSVAGLPRSAPTGVTALEIETVSILASSGDAVAFVDASSGSFSVADACARRASNISAPSDIASIDVGVTALGEHIAAASSNDGKTVRIYRATLR